MFEVGEHLAPELVKLARFLERLGQR